MTAGKDDIRIPVMVPIDDYFELSRRAKQAGYTTIGEWLLSLAGINTMNEWREKTRQRRLAVLALHARGRTNLEIGLALDETAGYVQRIVREAGHKPNGRSRK